MLDPQVKNIKLEIKNSPIDNKLMVAPTKIVFSDIKFALSNFINSYKIRINTDEMKTLPAKDKLPAVASVYIQGKWYLAFAENGSFFLSHFVDRKKVNDKLAQYNTDWELEIVNQELLSTLVA